MILVSACLLGVCCKYNGGDNKNQKVVDLVKKYNLIPVCPEQLGGLSTPRKPAEITAEDAKKVLDGIGKVVNVCGEDVTENFIKGAYETLKLAKLYDVKIAILKSKSPSCGCGFIYDGSFSGKLKSGNGVTTELLIQNGIKVYTEDVIDYKIIEKIMKIDY
ncbi:MAG: hypothetical protein JG776_1103 [Caloramator sp.]|jgi:uncharacterized protein YbbK (DUF523 family)|uniref:DUF523 domain-containing protein n=1 Tax=Caloramator sp. TaxID=1871330 RepID=UPI001DBCC504|nr:DUF523 domain-containing protein [Caloramator sp.]MBZ4663401.1 hypothetical protein [Caloramator sp.]